MELRKRFMKCEFYQNRMLEELIISDKDTLTTAVADEDIERRL